MTPQALEGRHTGAAWLASNRSRAVSAVVPRLGGWLWTGEMDKIDELYATSLQVCYLTFELIVHTCAAPAVPRAPAPSPKLTMGMPKATRGLASVFGTELTDGWLRPETSRASRDPPVQAPRPGLFFWRQTPDRQRCGDHQDGADNTNDRKLAKYYQVSLGHTLPLGRVSS